MPAPAQIATIKRGRKFDQVLEGARTVFLRDGFEGASVDDIAAEAGVSKATLYSYFPDKRILFLEVAKQESRRQADEAEVLVKLTAPPDCVLPEAARRIIAFTVSDLGLAVFRLCVAESDRFPDLGREFYASGPALVRDRLATYLNGAVARGELVIDDVYLAADQFAALCKAGIQLAVSFGVQRHYTEAERERVAKGAVEMFLARYGAKARAPA
ncbi:MAG: TetR/AcrR family transcriptional regulator [Rhodobacteraceae bacterium]|jgi:AcrR family transcriptional regulator|uniref:TetR/AcrR family transcriptional regulator n=1 Tax=Albidovulum sp. TaxID=1872424 RepID=UPI001D4DC62B|nr:TetR/AcrR family transcriptional regulator [uncultured Defluviimonas sp.]MCB2124387.1 TetR/AcrR family transcriptional regulator [Paracoccaceae bacterium]MCC0071306.1 TetR/AcrR family transcriptional regulator [Paracoccaceae bacterium]